jgi:hypothetical protein
MYQFEQIALGNPVGFQPPQEVTALCYNLTGGAVTKGHLGTLDLLGTNVATTSWEPGTSNSAYGNVVALADAELDYGVPVVVALEDIASGAEGKWQMCPGYIQYAAVGTDDDGVDDDASAGDKVYFKDGKSYFNINAGSGDYVAGILLDDVSSLVTDTPTYVRVLSTWKLCFTYPTAP